MHVDASTLGLVRIGRLHVALPATAIEEIVPGPLTLSPFPCAPAHVLGAFRRRGAPIPVIDLDQLLRPPEAPRASSGPEACALVLRIADGRFAVQVDAVAGVVRAKPEEITPLATLDPAQRGLFTEVYGPPDGGPVSVILDLEAVLGIAGLRTVVAAEATTMATDLRPRRPHLVFRVAERRFAVPLGEVQEVRSRPRVLDSDLPSLVVVGFHGIAGHLVPVAEFRAFLGLTGTAKAPAADPVLVVLGRGEAAVALVVDELVAVRSWADDEWEPLVDPSSAFGGVVDRADESEGGLILRLVAEQVLAHLGVSRQTVGTASAEAGPGEDAPPLLRTLIFHAGGAALAADLRDLEAVAHLPADLDGSAGVFAFQGRSIQLIGLGRALGRASAPLVPGQPVLVVRADAHEVGWVVDRVDFLQSGRPEPLAGNRARGEGEAGFTHRLRARNGDRDYAATVIDLPALVRRIAGGADASAA